MKRLFRSTLLLFALATITTGAWAGPRVVVTLQPLHGLVAGVAGERGEVHLLMPGGQSPHTYAFSPSHARALHRAEAVFAAGDTVEAFLTRPLQGIDDAVPVVWMMDLADITRLDARSGGAWPDHDHAHGADHGHDDDHDHGHNDGHGHGKEHDHGHDDGHGHGHEGEEHGHGGIDGHLWLSPANAIVFTRAVADTLVDIDPDHAAVYRANAERQIERIRALDRRLDQRLAAVRGLPYFVFHDAYQYFETHYGLNAMGSLTVDPDRPPGARRLREIRQRVDRQGVRCVFAEPQFQPRVVQAIAHETGVATGVLDPLGAGIEAGPDAWFELLEGLADGLEACLLVE